MKAGFFVLALLVLFLVPYASAWSNQTYMYVCDQAVKYVFGSDSLEACVYKQSIDFQKDFCSVIRAKVGEVAYNSCIAETGVVHPALMPTLFFNDPESHMDYSVCEIKNDAASGYLCGSVNENPALDEYNSWLSLAEASSNLCSKIYEFCIASSYLSDSFNPLSHIKYGVDSGSCAAIMDKKVENRILDPNPTDWSVSQVCSFKYTQNMASGPVAARYGQDFVVSNGTFWLLIRNLSESGSAMSRLQPTTEVTTQFVTTLPVITSIQTVVTTMETMPVTTVPSTTVPIEKRGESDYSWVVYLIILIVVLVVAYIALSNPEVRKTIEEALKSTPSAPSEKPERKLPRSRLTSLRGDAEEFSIMSENRLGSRLGGVWFRDEEKK